MGLRHPSRETPKRLALSRLPSRLTNIGGWCYGSAHRRPPTNAWVQPKGRNGREVLECQ